MKRQTSFFNFSIFRTDVKRFWWVPVLHFLSLVLFCVVPLWEKIEYILEYDSNYYGYYDDGYSIFLIQNSIFSYIAACTVPVFLSMLLFSYLQKKSAVATAHAQPVTRRSLFITHSVFGIAALTIPVLLTGVVFGFVQMTPGVLKLMYVSHIFRWMGVVLSYSFVIFALTTLIAMLTGSVVAQPIFTGIFALLPLFTVFVTKFFASKFWYGYNSQNEMALQNLYISPNILAAVPIRMTIYIALGLVLLAAAYVVYRLRHLENNSEVVAFPKLKSLFVYCVALCGGFLGEMYLIGTFDVQSLFWLIPFGVLGLIIANMLSQKAFTLKGCVKPGVVFFVTVIAMIAVFQWDITRFETRVPKAEDVESVVFEEPFYIEVRYSKNGQSIEKKHYDAEFTDLQEIKKIIQLHQYKAENREEHGFRGEFCLVYHMKNGLTLKRRYVMNAPSSAYMEAIWDTETYRKSKYPVLREDRSPVEYVAVSGFPRTFTKYSEEDREMIRRIEEALQQDIKATDSDVFKQEDSDTWYVEIIRKKEWVYTHTNTLVEEENIPPYLIGEETERYVIRPTYTHTITLLKELGIDPVFVGAENGN